MFSFHLDLHVYLYDPMFFLRLKSTCRSMHVQLEKIFMFGIHIFHVFILDIYRKCSHLKLRLLSIQFAMIYMITTFNT